MSQGTSEAVARIEATRGRLDAEVEELQRRIPPMVEGAKRRTLTVAVVAGGGLVVVAGAVVVRRRRARRRSTLSQLSAEVSGVVRQALAEATGSLAAALPEGAVDTVEGLIRRAAS